MISFVLLSVVFISVYSSISVTSNTRIQLLGVFSIVALSLFLMLAFVALTTMYYLLDNFTFFLLYMTDIPGDSVLFAYNTHTFLLNQAYISLNPINVYYFPFLYIFISITILSILFCLAYNTNELSAFLLYCLIILTAGYSMFFTSSLLIFFLAYEMLLVPSFFILYNFAKTRKCVEAAYLMFFWTQFGALFLIFAFLYLFYISNSHSFEVISLIYFSTYELNFLFLCMVCGFGVKLPI